MERAQKIWVITGISAGIVLMTIFSIMSVLHPENKAGNAAGKNGSGSQIQSGAANEKNPTGNSGGGNEGIKPVQNTGEADTVVWGVNYEELPSAASVDVLNQYLQKQGYDFALEIRQVDTAGYSAKELQEKYPDVDIMQLPPEYPLNNSAAKLIREGYYLPLSTFLQGKGRKLKKQIPDMLWEQVKVDHEIYTVPNTSLEYRGAYFQFNPDYISRKDIKNFDGTIQDVHRILHKSNPTQMPYPVVIGDSVLFGMNYADLTGVFFYYGLALEENGDKVVPWYQADGVQKFYELLNNWYNMRYLGSQSFTVEDTIDNKKAEKDFQKGRYMVKIGVGAADESKGVVRYVRKWQGSKINISTGIVATSAHREQALALLQLAYTDTHVADLLIYGVKGKDYTLVDGLVKNTNPKGKDDYYLKRINMGNSIANTPLDTAGYKSLRKEMTEYFETSGQVAVSPYLGFVADFSGYGETINNLLNLELDHENVWLVTDLEYYGNYDILINKCSKGKHREYAGEIKQQIQKWKKNKNKK